MNVWILTAYIPYEADTIVAVFDGEEKAVARREKMEKQTERYQAKIDRTGDWSIKQPHEFTHYHGYGIECHKLK